MREPEEATESIFETLVSPRVAQGLCQGAPPWLDERSGPQSPPARASPRLRRARRTRARRHPSSRAPLRTLRSGDETRRQGRTPRTSATDMSGRTSSHPDTPQKDRPSAGRVSSCAHDGDGLTKTSRFGPVRLGTLSKRRPDLRCMCFTPAAPSTWPPQRASIAGAKADRHGNGLRLNEKSNPQEPESPRP